MSERFHYRQSDPRPRRRGKTSAPARALAPDVMLPPITRLIYPYCVAPDKAAWSAMALGQRALSLEKMREAERWLAIAGRFVTLGRGLAVLKTGREIAEARFEDLMDTAEFLSGIEPESEAEASALIKAVVDQWHEADAEKREAARQQAGANAAG